MSIVVPARPEAKTDARPSGRDVVVLDAVTCEELWCGDGADLGLRWHDPAGTDE